MGWEDIADGRCDCAGGMHHPSGFVCSSTLWHTPSCLHICTYCDRVADLHLQHWCVQCNHLQPAHISSSVPVLHVQLLQEMRQGWVGVSWGHRPLHHRSVSSLQLFVDPAASLAASASHSKDSLKIKRSTHQPNFV